MATRRSLATGGSEEEDDYSALFEAAGGGVEEPADRLQWGGLTGDESALAGNRETAREFQGGQMPTTLAAKAMPTNLPESVTIQDRMPEPSMGGMPEPSMGGGEEAPDFFSQMSVPAKPQAPTPTASLTPQPSVAPSSEAMPGMGPQRRSISPGATSTLFGEEGGSPLFGRAGGLLGGGKGVPGTDAGGPEPTAMMLQLLRALRSGEMG